MKVEPMYDVVVVGAGVVGCAVARRLAGAGLSVLLAEARRDIGDGTSKANTAILHTGFDATPDTLESTLVRQGYHQLRAYCEEADISVEQIGAILVAWDDEQAASLPYLANKAAHNGCFDTRLMSADEVREVLPHLGAGVTGGLEVPGESIIDPWSVTLAYANDFLARGGELRLNCRVTGAVRDGEKYSETTTLQTSQGPITTRWVVNAAGLGADTLDAVFGHSRFTVTPRKGQLIVFDKAARALVSRIVLPVPTERGKGVLVSPTIFGNVMVGPTAEDLDPNDPAARLDTDTTPAGLELLRGHARRLVPELEFEEVTAAYAGLRAATEHGDYVVEVDGPQGYAVLGGIRSTGLTSSLALADYLAEALADAGLDTAQRPGMPPTATVPVLGEGFERPHRRADLIAADPAYGEIICFCERVTRGEVRDALASKVPPSDLDGLRRRTRVMMGRCQGFYCGAEVSKAMKEAGIQ